jgi:ABC-type glycerol-3-phosphate transport system substrate-binding protein
MNQKMKRMSWLVALIQVIASFAGIGIAKGKKAVKITFLNSKGEIQASLETAAKVFAKQNPGVTLEILPCPAGQSPYVIPTSTPNKMYSAKSSDNFRLDNYERK